MIVRLFLFFLIVFGLVFTLFWTVFRTRYFNTGRVVEILKCAALTLASIVVAVAILGGALSLEKLS